MSTPHALRSNEELISTDWLPTATKDRLAHRAGVLRFLREFFFERGVLEVETPVLSQAGTTDLHLTNLETTWHGGVDRRLFLQTSPEYAMKRLLASGSGAIYQIAKAFRDDESGRLHNPEFTLLEWYRVGWDHQALMNEIDELLALLLDESPAERLTYAEAFDRHLQINPHQAPIQQLRKSVREWGVVLNRNTERELGRDDLLQLLMSEAVEPNLADDRPTFIYDFPESQSALARIRSDNPPVAERFEVYVGGLELANGYHELTEPNEQAERFTNDLRRRLESGRPEVPIDQNLLSAMRAGLPSCAGVALGIDRLVMLASNASHIDEVLAFPIDRA